jgi:hypothetical protein
MAAGCFIAPYLMPYHLVLIIPLIGKTQGWRQVLIWASSWFVLLGLGLGSSWQIISYIFPLTAYCLTGSFSTYMMNTRENLNQLNAIRKWSIPGINYGK